MVRRPLSQRDSPEGTADYDGPHDGVPAWLMPSLIEWVMGLVTYDDMMGGFDVKRDTVLTLSRRCRANLPHTVNALGHALAENPRILLDVVDVLLEDVALPRSYDNWPYHVRKLDLILYEAGSLYTVGSDAEGNAQLQKRLAESAAAAGERAMTATDRAAEHLRAAWSKAYGRDPDANGAYEHAVKAVEAAGKPIVSPQNSATTLGTMIADMRNKPEKWTTAVDYDDGVQKVIGMMELLWRGHYRHGDETKPITHDQGAAEMAVQLAVVLVQWFRSGAVRLA